MAKLIIFCIITILLIIISRRSLFSIRNHGFYRFLAWECIAWLIASNYIYWFSDPFSQRQMLSWAFLLVSIYLVMAGAMLLKKAKPGNTARHDQALYGFEKTTQLVDYGIYRFIRHPMYASLLFLTWGIFLKHITFELLAVAIAASLFIYLTAILDEKECVRYFGDPYVSYMQKTKRFIPFVL